MVAGTLSWTIGRRKLSSGADYTSSAGLAMSAGLGLIGPAEVQNGLSQEAFSDAQIKTS